MTTKDKNGFQTPFNDEMHNALNTSSMQQTNDQQS